ncbi:MAG: 2-C-methyl-D-erythritol 2,4-cyclodiphosphate synthase [Nitrospirae bacterium]|nr:MAG: 2-C-methyl-D-erythritol 2,4-cyclodiphosphate synthase [Nitrospirota bacterium]
MRVGLGYDIHPFCQGRPLILGGVQIPHSHGLDGHSDADVLTHAVCDALLGAMGQGDLGRHFPPDDPRYTNFNSLHMLQEVVGLMRNEGFRVVNLDTTILAQAPKLAPYLSQIAAQLAQTLGVDPTLVNVKVKSGEKLGTIGRQEGIAAQAICLLAPTVS